MTSTCHREIGPDQPMVYQIRLKGQLDARWTDWFGGMAVDLTEDGAYAALPARWRIRLRCTDC